MQNVDMGNGLECRICLGTFRLFYVENTEDYLYRWGKLGIANKLEKKRNRDQKQKSLEELLQKKFGPILSEPLFM